MEVDWVNVYQKVNENTVIKTFRSPPGPHPSRRNHPVKTAGVGAAETEPPPAESKQTRREPNRISWIPIPAEDQQRRNQLTFLHPFLHVCPPHPFIFTLCDNQPFTPLLPLCVWSPPVAPVRPGFQIRVDPLLGAAVTRKGRKALVVTTGGSLLGPVACCGHLDPYYDTNEGAKPESFFYLNFCPGNHGNDLSGCYTRRHR